MRILIYFFLVTFFFACQPKNEVNEKDRLPKIVCTTGMLADLTKALVKEQAEVIALMGPGVDPHLYKATQGDLKHLSEAELIVYNGLHLEGKMGEIFEKLEKRKNILVAADALSTEVLINNSDFQGAYDPHLWFDVSLWSEIANYLSKELKMIPSIDIEKIKANRENYTKELKELDNWVKEEIASIDPKQRVLITAHDAFGYFGRAYNIEVRGLQGISTLSEYGLKDVSDLVDFIVEREIRAVFVESSVSDRSLQAVVEGCKQKGHQIEIGGTLFSDAMGEKGSPEGTYIGMVKYNVNTIVEALK